MINDMISDKQSLLNEISALRQEFSKSESNITISKYKIMVAFLNNLINKAKDNLKK